MALQLVIISVIHHQLIMLRLLYTIISVISRLWERNTLFFKQSPIIFSLVKHIAKNLMTAQVAVPKIFSGRRLCFQSRFLGMGSIYGDPYKKHKIGQLSLRYTSVYCDDATCKPSASSVLAALSFRLFLEYIYLIKFAGYYHGSMLKVRHSPDRRGAVSKFNKSNFQCEHLEKPV